MADNAAFADDESSPVDIGIVAADHESSHCRSETEQQIIDNIQGMGGCAMDAGIYFEIDTLQLLLHQINIRICNVLNDTLKPDFRIPSVILSPIISTVLLLVCTKSLSEFSAN